MSDTTWHYLSNQFEQATRTSFKRCNILNNDHLSKLTSEGADPTIADLVTRTTPLSTAYSSAYSVWISASATYKGHTQLVDGLLSQLSSTKIKQWDIQIQGQHLEGTPEYTMILPDRRQPFQQGTKDDRLSEVEALATRLLDYPALAATQTDVDAFATLLRTARDNQQQREQLAAMASDQLEVARLALCTIMYGNLGVLMDKYRATPNMVENFWQLDLIRRTGQGSGNDDDLPDTSVSISGRVTDNFGNPLSGVEVTLYGSSSGPGPDDPVTYTDANGDFIFSFDDIPGPNDIVILAKLSGYNNSSINLYVEPGNTYTAQDLTMNPNP